MDLLYLEANPWNEDEERRYGNTRRLLNLANDLGYKVSNILYQCECHTHYDYVY